MFVVTGVTGQVGAVVASSLLDQSLPVRAVVRNAEKGMAWKQRGAELAIADMTEATSLATAFAAISFSALRFQSCWSAVSAPGRRAPGLPER